MKTIFLYCRPCLSTGSKEVFIKKKSIFVPQKREKKYSFVPFWGKGGRAFIRKIFNKNSIFLLRPPLLRLPVYSSANDIFSVENLEIFHNLEELELKQSSGAQVKLYLQQLIMI